MNFDYLDMCKWLYHWNILLFVIFPLVLNKLILVGCYCPVLFHGFKIYWSVLALKWAWLTSKSELWFWQFRILRYTHVLDFAVLNIHLKFPLNSCPPSFPAVECTFVKCVHFVWYDSVGFSQGLDFPPESVGRGFFPYTSKIKVNAVQVFPLESTFGLFL